MGILDGQVAFITGAARGQGRSHAVTLAAAGADIIAVDLCAQIESVPYPLASPEDLAETVREVEGLGRRAVSAIVDVRDRDALRKALDDGVAQLGGPDIVLANAGILPTSAFDKDPQTFDDVVSVNLTGVYNTVEVAKPALIERANGSIVLTSSTAGLKGYGGDSPGIVGYAAAKHGVVGLMRIYANFFAPYGIRVNTVHPTGVNTEMALNEAVEQWAAHNPSSAGMTNAMPVRRIDAIDVSNAILWLVSDAARYVTGVALPVDAGFLVK